MALLLPPSLSGTSITDGNQIALCLIGGMISGFLTGGIYTTLVFPLLPRSNSYLLRRLPRVIGYNVLMVILWVGLWIGGGYIGAPAFIAQHFLACLWSTIAWAGMTLLIMAKGWFS